MAQVDVTFINPANNAELDVELDDGMNSAQVIQALIENQFITPLTDPTLYYRLAIKGKDTIAEGQTLANAGVHSTDRISVSVTNRGGSQWTKEPMCI